MKFEKLTKKQNEGLKLLLSNRYIQILFDGGSRAGKTFLIIMTAIMLCRKYPGIRILVARLRFAHAKASIWLQTLLPILQYCFNEKDYKLNRNDYIVKIGTSEIWMGGLDDKDRTDKVLGQEFGMIFLNEAVRIAKTTRDKVLTRLAQKIDGFKNFIVYDCNPGHPLHYLYKEFYIEDNVNRTNLHWLPEDNRENLSDDYIENVLDNLTGHEKKRFRYGEWASLPGAVYNNVKEDNIIDTVQDFGYYDDIVIGQDWGYYSATCIWGMKDNKAYCIAENVVIGGTTKHIITGLEELDKTWYIKENQYIIYADHEPDRIQEVEDAGYIVKKAYKEVGAGDSTVNEMELYFDKNCMSTFQSMLNLVRQQDGHGTYIDKHVKENDHEADATRYALHGYKKDNACGEPVFIKL